MSEIIKNLLMWLFIAITMFSVFSNFSNEPSTKELSYSEFISQVESDQVLSVEFLSDNYTLKGKTVNGESFITVRPPFLQDDLSETLSDHRVAVTGEKPEEQSILKQLLIASFPILIILAVFIFFMRQMQGGMGGKSGPMSFGKSKAKMLEGGRVKTTFADVAGIEEAKEEVQEVVDFLREPSKFQKLGGKIPTGILMTGSPGTGKTLLARAIAGEAQVPFFTISGSDFVEMFVGVGASRVRDLFEQAKKQSPCIVFIDEIDAVGRHRGAGMGGGHDEREQTLNQILVEMDGFDNRDHVILLAATNRPDVLDKALLRPGRFDRQIVVDSPTVDGREAILKIHTKKIPLHKNVNLLTIAKGTPGLVGADLENLANEAALLTARKDKKKVSMLEFEEAKDKVMLGVERKSMILTDNEKKITAYHEAGHALVAFFTKNTDPVHKITIIPRGMALGLTAQLPKHDMHNYSKKYLLAKLDVLMGGRSAEKMIFKDTSSGAGNDIEVATNISRKMISEWGMSDKIGPITFSLTEGNIYGQMGNSKKYGEEISKIIDEEIKNFIFNAEKNADNLLKKREKELHDLAKALLVYETIDAPQLTKIMNGESLHHKDDSIIKSKATKKRTRRTSQN